MIYFKLTPIVCKSSSVGLGKLWGLDTLHSCILAVMIGRLHLLRFQVIEPFSPSGFLVPFASVEVASAVLLVWSHAISLHECRLPGGTLRMQLRHHVHLPDSFQVHIFQNWKLTEIWLFQQMFFDVFWPTGPQGLSSIECAGQGPISNSCKLRLQDVITDGRASLCLNLVFIWFSFTVTVQFSIHCHCSFFNFQVSIDKFQLIWISWSKNHIIFILCWHAGPR